MQAYDDRDRLVETQILDGVQRQENTDRTKSLVKIDQLQGALETAKKKAAKYAIIAQIPNAGQVVEINGLKFRVTFASKERKKLHLELLMPEIESVEISFPEKADPGTAESSDLNRNSE